MPRVSIITALHNKAAYVAETIRSVLAQSVADWEMIVVENGSSDEGPEIVRHFSDPRVRLMISPKLGPGAARNFGLEHATGDWALFLDADDLLESWYLENRLATVQQDPTADIVCGPWVEFQDGNPADKEIRRPVSWVGDEAALKNAAIAYAPWVLHAAIIKRAALSHDCWWPEQLDRLPSEDAAFWFQLLQNAKVTTEESAGAVYRLNTSSSRDAVHDVTQRAQGLLAVVEHNRAVLASRGLFPTPAQRANVVRVFERAHRQAVLRGQNETAQLLLRQASVWLRDGEVEGPGMWLRRCFGMRLFNSLRFGAS